MHVGEVNTWGCCRSGAGGAGLSMMGSGGQTLGGWRQCEVRV